MTRSELRAADRQCGLLHRRRRPRRVCQPVAPSGSRRRLGSGLRRRRRCRWPGPAACARPAVASQARTTAARCRSRRPAASVASCHGPSSTRTSTLEMPRCCAQATPATVDRAGRRPLRRRAACRSGTAVLIGACCAQPRGTQYASKSAKRGQLQLGEPLAWPTRSRRGPGTTIRTGKPCSTGSGSPFIPTASIASRPSRSAAVGRAAGPAVDRAADHLVGAVERIAPRRAGP